MPSQFAFISAVTALALAGSALAAGCGSEDGSANVTKRMPHAKVDRFDGGAAYRSVARQVALGPRPAGSAASRTLARQLRRALPRGRFQPVGGGLRNVAGTVVGRDPSRTVIVGAHYDTKDLPGFIGANDGASGTAIVSELARTIEPRSLEPTIVFLMLDGEEAPAGTPEDQFERYGMRGSKAAAPRYRHTEAMVLLDFVGERGLRIPYEPNSDRDLWTKLRAAARRAGVARVFPDETGGPILDDHVQFAKQGVPAIDLIDVDFPCWHQICDDLSVISPRSLDAVGETVHELLRTL